MIRRFAHTLVRTDFKKYDTAFVVNQIKYKQDDKIFVNIGYCKKSKIWKNELKKENWDFIITVYHCSENFVPHGLIFYAHCLDYKIFTEISDFKKNIHFLLMK